MCCNLAMTVQAIVLAAGASSRLGHPKALLDFDGKTALELILDALAEVGIGSGVVVTGDHAEEIERAVDPAPFRYARNPDPAAGRLGSIRIGLSALEAPTDVLLWPVDRPFARGSTVRSLVDAREEGAAAGVIVPECDGGRGHPILLRERVLPRVLAAPPDADLRRVLAESGVGRRPVPVDDPGIHPNLDTREAYARALSWWRAGGAGG
jgi:molybdenum cofactor cytidylyltransferase